MNTTTPRTYITLALAATIALAACGGAETGDTAPSPIGTRGTVAEESTDEPGPTASAAASTTTPAPTPLPDTTPEPTTPAPTTPPATAPPATAPPATAPVTEPEPAPQPEATPYALAPHSHDIGADVAGFAPMFTLALSVDTPDGLAYSEPAMNELRVGPDQISIDELGRVHVSDPLNDRIMTIQRDGAYNATSFVDLTPAGVTYTIDFIATEGDLIILDDAFGFPRIIRLSYDGQILDEIAVPEPYQLQNGLAGLHDTGDDERIVLDVYDLVAGEWTFVEWSPDQQQWVPSTQLSIDGRVIGNSGPTVTVDGVTLPIDATPDNEWWASLRFRGRAADGTVVVERWDGASAVEWWSTDGFVAASEVHSAGFQEIEDAFAEFAVTDDGRVFTLLTQPESVFVVELMPGPRLITE